MTQISTDFRKLSTANALRGYEIGRTARGRAAYVVFGGIHATLYPEEAVKADAVFYIQKAR